MKLLLVIFLLTLTLRIIFLDKVPVGFYPDEAAFAYDSYSLSQTLKDQWGHFLPVTLESFGDYKYPLSAYLAIPAIKILGLSVFSSRITESLISSFSIFIVFLLAGEIAESLTKKSLFQYSASFLLTISSWHIMLSREFFGFTLTSFFLPLGIYFFIKGSTGNYKFLVFSVIIFSLNLMTYPHAFFVTPFILLALFILFKKEVFSLKKHQLFRLFALVSVFIFLFLTLYANGSTIRLEQTNLLSSSLEQSSINKINLVREGVPSFITQVIHNKYLYAFKNFITNYTSYFSPEFLFTKGPGEESYAMIKGQGVLYWFEIPFLIAGILFIFKNYKNKLLQVLALWILLSPIPASLAGGIGYAANRASVVLSAIQIVLALGFVHIYFYLKKILSFKKLIILYSIFIILAALNFFYFLESYFIQSKYKIATLREYGNVEALEYVKSLNKNYKEIIVSRKLSEPHIYAAVVFRYNPKDYQENTKNWKYKEDGKDWVDEMIDYKLGNFTFRNINWSIDQSLENTILVGHPEEFPDNVDPEKTIYYPSGEKAIYIVEPTLQPEI